MNNSWQQANHEEPVGSLGLAALSRQIMPTLEDSLDLLASGWAGWNGIKYCFRWQLKAGTSVKRGAFSLYFFKVAAWSPPSAAMAESFSSAPFSSASVSARRAAASVIPRWVAMAISVP